MIYQTVDAHAAGEPLRIIVSGVPPIPGATMLEKREYFRTKFDEIRTRLMFEPRGHNDMYGCVITPPVAEGSDVGVLFMHNEGYSTMCGHGVIALVTVAVQNKMIRNPSKIRIDTPAGLVKARADVEGDRVKSVTFENVPSFVFMKDIDIEGTKLDIVFGGAFYALTESRVAIEAKNLDDLRQLGMRLKYAIEKSYGVVHPLEPGLRGIYGTIFTGPGARSGSDVRNVTVFADAEVDRSPCGTGTCGILASRFARGVLGEGEVLINESIIGTTFKGTVISQTKVASFDAIVPEVSGSAHITGFHSFVIDAEDPVADGFRIR